MRRYAHGARLYPNARQVALLDGQGQAAWALRNLIHEWYTWGGRGSSIARRPSVAQMDWQIREARTNPLPGWEWMARLPAQATQHVLKDYLRAWDRFHRRLSRPPKFRNRRAHLAIDIPQGSALNITRMNLRWAEVTIPFIGRVRFRLTRPLPGISRNCPGRITGARLIKDSLGWHILFRIEEPAVEVSANPGPPVGVDRGVVHTMALSNGAMLDMPTLLTEGETRRLLGLQHKAARQQLMHKPGAPMSNRQRRTLGQIAALRARQGRRREDWLHRKTTDLTKHHGVIVVEDLRILNLVRSAHGTVDRPGSNVKAKAGLNRAILGMAWGKAGRMLSYKCTLRGGVLVKVDPRNSSMECARCGYTSAANRVGQATFRCLACRHAGNADTNAAQVVLQRGLTALSGATPGYGGNAREAWKSCRTVNRQSTASATGSQERIRNPHPTDGEDINTPTSIRRTIPFRRNGDSTPAGGGPRSRPGAAWRSPTTTASTAPTSRPASWTSPCAAATAATCG